MKRSDDSSRDELFDESDPLWHLLGRAPMPEPDGWFVARALARCRAEGRSALSFLRLSPMWRWAMGGGVSLCLAVALLVAQVHSEQVTKQRKVQEAFEIMASIDTDPDSAFSSQTSSSTTSWQDTSL